MKAHGHPGYDDDSRYPDDEPMAVDMSGLERATDKACAEIDELRERNEELVALIMDTVMVLGEREIEDRAPLLYRRLRAKALLPARAYVKEELERQKADGIGVFDTRWEDTK